MAEADGPTAAWFAFLEQGRFMIQYSPATRRFVFYPRMFAPGSGVADLEWVEASGRAIVYATTVLREKPPKADRNVAIVELEEGLRMMTCIEGLAPGDVRIGMTVQGRVSRPDGAAAVLVFDPVAS